MTHDNKTELMNKLKAEYGELYDKVAELYSDHKDVLEAFEDRYKGEYESLKKPKGGCRSISIFLLLS